MNILNNSDPNNYYFLARLKNLDALARSGQISIKDHSLVDFELTGLKKAADAAYNVLSAQAASTRSTNPKLAAMAPLPNPEPFDRFSKQLCLNTGVRFSDFKYFFEPRIDQLIHWDFTKADPLYLVPLTTELTEMKMAINALQEIAQAQSSQLNNAIVAEKADYEKQYAIFKVFSNHSERIEKLEAARNKWLDEIKSLKKPLELIGKIQKRLPAIATAPLSKEDPSTWQKLKLLARDKGGFSMPLKKADRPPAYNPDAEFPEVPFFLEKLKWGAAIGAVAMQRSLLN